MAMVIVVAMILPVVTLWLWRAEKAFYAWLDSKKPKPVEEAETEPMPDDIIAHARGFGTDWAQQQTLDAAYEMYGKLKDWQKVRAAMGFSSGTI